jgi:hypothetical protein
MDFEFFRSRLEYPLNEYLLIDPTGMKNPRNALVYCLVDHCATLDESTDAEAFAQWMHSQGVPVVDSPPDLSPRQGPFEQEGEMIPDLDDTQ